MKLAGKRPCEGQVDAQLFAPHLILLCWNTFARRPYVGSTSNIVQNVAGKTKQEAMEASTRNDA